jgi:cupin superfamily acireductone dioxygenase involved in methionine salvage
MTVSRDELQAAIDTLSKKIDDRHDKIILKWDQIAKELSDTNINIGRFLEKFDYQEDANTRLSTDIKDIKDEQIVISKDIVELKTNQKNSKNFWDKFGVPLMFMAIAGLTTINYFKA